MRDMYRQCRLLRRLSPTSTTEQVAFIPEEYAVVGRTLRIRENGEWVEGWKVMDAGSPTPRAQVDVLHSVRTRGLSSLER